MAMRLLHPGNLRTILGMQIRQRELRLSPRPRGFHIITAEIEDGLPQLAEVKNGLAHLFLKHTTAALTLNENASPDVRGDLEFILNAVVPEGRREYRHILEGPDDMPSHAKSSLLGTGLTVPITNGRLNLGTWQGIYLCEHRNNAGSRRVLATILS